MDQSILVLRRRERIAGKLARSVLRGLTPGKLGSVTRLNLIIEMRKRGWIWTEEYVWHKRNSYPGKWPNRFRDAWERCIHFTKAREFNMYQEAVMVPMGDWQRTRLNSLSKNDYLRQKSRTKSGFGWKMANWTGRKMAYPANVLHLATVSSNKGHSAAFPTSLPEWFIKLFTKVGDTVLDPFMGSGTTLRVAQNLNRNSIGIELLAAYCEAANQELVKTQCSNISATHLNLTQKTNLINLQEKERARKNTLTKPKKRQ